jgi:hypothetical protein
MKKIVFMLTVLLSVSAIIISVLLFRNRTNKIQYKDDIEIIKGGYVDKLGRQVSFTQAAQKKLSELEAISQHDSLELNNYQKKLSWAYTEIKALNNKLKSVSEFTTGETKLSGDFIEPLKDTLIEEQDQKFAYYTNGYLDEMILLNKDVDSVKVYYSHIDTLLLVDFWKRKPKKNGNQVFFLWRWLRPWEVQVEAKTSDPNSIIYNLDKTIIKK